jgi:Undecaprenyl-phosphate galactose phosphotransferase WbaP
MSTARPAPFPVPIERPRLHRAIAQQWSAAALLLADSSALILSAALSVAVWHAFDSRLMPSFYAGIWPVLFLFPLAYAAYGLYPGFGRGPVDELRRTSICTSLVYAALAVTIFLMKDAEHYSRAAFLLAWTQTLIAVPLGRALIRASFGKKAWWGEAVIVVGTGRAARSVADSLSRRTQLGLKPALLLEPENALKLDAHWGIRHAIIIGGPQVEVGELYHHLSGLYPRLTILPDLNGMPSLWAEPRDIAGTLGFEMRQRLLMVGPRFAKRAVDLCIIAAGAIIAIPVMLAISLCIKLTTSGPVFYGQRRLGVGGRPFFAWKFRTMVENAGDVLENCLRTDPALSSEWDRNHKLKRDPRVTLVGRFLRRTSLDELPQLWNVLRGDMSIVGPRPIVPAEIPRYGRAYELYQKVLPGLTGLWQVSGRNNLSYAERVECDIYYIRNWSPWLDLYILARTVVAVLMARGAY